MQMEDVILKEINYFHEALENHKEQPLDVKDQLTRSVSNVATYIIFGRRFEYDAEQLVNLQFQEFLAVFVASAAAPLLRVRSTNNVIKEKYLITLLRNLINKQLHACRPISAMCILIAFEPWSPKTLVRGQLSIKRAQPLY